MIIILWRDFRVNAWISWLYGFSLVFWKNTRNRSVLGADYDKFFRQKASLEFDPRTPLSWEKQQLGKGSVLGFVLGFCIPPKLSANKSVKKSLYPGINAWIQAWKFAKIISCWTEVHDVQPSDRTEYGLKSDFALVFKHFSHSWMGLVLSINT